MPRHALAETVENIDGNLRDSRQEAADKFAALQAVQQKVAEATTAGQQITPETPLFVELDEAGKAYGEVEDRIRGMEVTKASLVAQMGQTGLEPGGDGGSSEDYVAQLRELGSAGGFGQGGVAGLLRALNAQTPGQRITAGEQWKKAAESGLFLRSEWGAPIPLGESMNRDELRAALITGNDSGSAGAFVTPDRQGYYALPMRPFTVLDLITIGETDSDLVEYVKMLTLTNAAAEVAEASSAADIGGGAGEVTALVGGLKPESAMTFGIVQEAVKTIAHLVPATRRALNDAGQLRTIIDGVLRWGLGDRLERQVVAGDGAGENLRGLLNITGTNAIAAGTKSHADKIHNGITANRIDGYLSTGVVMNPLDAETIWLSRENTGGAGTGGYLFGNPNNPGPRTLWGLPVAETPAMPAGTALVGNLRAYIFWLREGAQVLATDSHKDWFARNIIAVLAEMRGAAGLPTPEAIAEVNLAAA